MPNDTNPTPAGRRLDATCPACAGAVDLDAMRARLDAANDMVRRLCLPRGYAQTREWIMSIPPRPDCDPDLVIGQALHDMGRLLDRAALASARPPADDGLTAAYLYGVEHGRDARARTPGAEGEGDARDLVNTAMSQVRGLIDRCEREGDDDETVRVSAAELQDLHGLLASDLAAPAPAPVGEDEADALIDAFQHACFAHEHAVPSSQSSLAMHRAITRNALRAALLRAAGAPARGAEGAG